LDYQLKLNALNTDKFAIQYNFKSAIDKYKKICAKYNLNSIYGGLRLWLTDDTSMTETFANMFGDNVIQTTVNSLSGMGQQYKSFIKATGTELGGSIGDTLDKGIDTVTSSISGGKQGSDEGLMSGLGDIFGGVGAIEGGLKTAKDMVLHGKSISLPKINTGSSYNPTMSLTIKLVSPYGSVKAIQKYILEPLLYILIMMAPRSRDGLSYGLSPPVKVKAYGLCDINLGSINSVSIVRGSSGTSYNIFKQPLSSMISISIAPLTDGFAVMEGDAPEIVSYNNSLQVYENKVHSGDEYLSISSPAITTLGNVIQSFGAAPPDVVSRFHHSDDAGSKPKTSTISTDTQSEENITSSDNLLGGFDQLMSNIYGSSFMDDLGGIFDF
jgi:hypothetical protein